MTIRKKYLFITLFILSLNFSFAQSNWEAPAYAEKEVPDFIIGSYGFYPKQQCIAHLRSHIPAWSSAGIPVQYFVIEDDEIDYKSFKVIEPDLGLAKDKNYYYLNGKNTRINSSEKLVYKSKPGYSGLVDPKQLEKSSDYKRFGCLYKKKDTLYVYRDRLLQPIILSDKTNIDKLSFLTDNLYQDNTNIYSLSYYSSKQMRLKVLIKNEHIDKTVYYLPKYDYEDKQYLLIGKHSIYQSQKTGNHDLLKSSSYRKKSYKILKGNYYMYNKELYHINNPYSILDFDKTYGHAIESLDYFKNDKNFKQYPIKKTKLRILSNDLAVYDSLLFKKKYSVKLPKSIDLKTLECLAYYEDFPYHNSTFHFEINNSYFEDIEDKHEYLLRDKNSFYHLSGRDLLHITKIKQNWEFYNHKTKSVETKNLSFDLQSFDIINENYHSDKNGVYYRGAIKETLYEYGKVRGNRYNFNFITRSKDKLVFKNQVLVGLRTNKTKTLGPYAYNKNTLYFGYIRVPKKISMKINLKKLKQIEDSFYYTDGVHILFQDQIIAKFNKKNLKVHNKHYLEDDNQLIYNGICKLKSDLGLNQK